MPLKQGSSLTIHRLQSGGHIQMAPLSLLEGCPVGPNPPAHIPGCPRLNREVCALHQLARRGELSMDAAERQLNAYLPAAASQRLVRHPKHLRWMLLSIADAPHHTHLPDLGYVIHRVLSRRPLPGSLSAVVEHSIPCLRHTTAPIPFADSQDVLLNLVLSMLLGLYPGGNIKRPSFGARAGIYARVHALLTASREAQTEFCQRHTPVVLLSCMEYVARVLPAYIPAQTAFLVEKDPNTGAYFRRIPALCDELRMGLDDAAPPEWSRVNALCDGVMDKVMRLKKSNTVAPVRDMHNTLLAPTPPQVLAALWNAPLLTGAPSADEFRILGMGLDLPKNSLQCVQRSVRVSQLPGNLSRLQRERLAEACCGTTRSTFLKSRYHICMQCTLSHKNPSPLRLRLDTLTQRMVCSSCATDQLISVNMVGRILQLRNQFLYLCPGCISIQEYKGEQIWLPHAAQCVHAARQQSKRGPRQRKACFTCQEPANQIVVERVDHRTGRMTQFSFCQRHVPRVELLMRCVNAGQIEHACA